MDREPLNGLILVDLEGGEEWGATALPTHVPLTPGFKIADQNVQPMVEKLREELEASRFFYSLRNGREFTTEIDKFMTLDVSAMIAANALAQVVFKARIGDYFEPKLVRRKGHISGKDMRAAIDNVTIALLPPLMGRHHEANWQSEPEWKIELRGAPHDQNPS